MSVAVTQCPHCQAKFRVRDEHVRAHSGLVRCGACRGIFDARLNVIEGELSPLLSDSEADKSPSTIVQGMSAVSADPQDAVIRGAAREAIEATSSFSAMRSNPKESMGKTRITAKRDEDDYRDESYDWRAPERPLSPAAKAGYAFLSLLLTSVFLAQAAYWFRDELAGRFPTLSMPLSAICQQLGCRVSPPKNSQALGFVGSDLAADPAHRGLHVFSATLRNSSDTAVAFPSLILTLDGANGVAISRRIFSPEQYAPASASLARGIEAGAEVEIKLYLDVSPALPVGFKADHAYF